MAWVVIIVMVIFCILGWLSSMLIPKYKKPYILKIHMKQDETRTIDEIMDNALSRCGCNPINIKDRK